MLMLPDIHSITLDDARAQFKLWDEPAYRADQLFEWLYRVRAQSWDSMSNLPKSLRHRLQESYSFGRLELLHLQGARDTTQKFLWRLGDGALVESVLIPANPSLYGEPNDRHTLCVSTQVGCAYGCKFCASGLEGWKRNLTTGEIVGQVLAIEQWNEKEAPAVNAGEAKERLVNNLVIMGMGEPLANYDNLLKALRILNAPWGGGIGARKITISTSGLVPQIKLLAADPLQFRLAISLHGATDLVRDRIMPVNRKYPLAELASACSHYVRQKGRMITLEYILLAGVNDSIDQAMLLSRLAQRLHAKVNLIPYNQVDGLAWQRPETAVQEAFLAALTERKISATLRREKGHDIDAACGQLRLKTERKAKEAASAEVHS